MMHKRTQHAEPSWLSFLLGALLLTHFIIVCAIKSAQGIPGDVLWMSHIALVFAGGGLLLGSRVFLGAALTAIAVPHSLWLYDFIASLITGDHPLRITQYLHGADILTWMSTAHHFYLLPLLCVLVLRSTRYQFASLALASLLIIIATALSRMFLPQPLNVNFAFATLPGVDLAPLHWLNGRPTGEYLLVQLSWQILVFMAPTAFALRWLTRHRPVQAPPNRHGSWNMPSLTATTAH